MAEAPNCIAQLGIDDENEQDESATTYRRRTTGKKSGSLMLAADVVKKTIEWPHLHVRRMVAGRKKSVPYAELNVEEFVCWFLGMIEAPTCKWDYREMTRILRIIIQDTIDFSRTSALGFYEHLGLAVE